MADYKDQQSTDPAKAGEPSSNESEALRQEGMDGAYGSSCCTPGKKAFHPWESDTWECETDETCDTSDATSASSLNSESLETTQPEPMDRTFAARPDAAQDTALWQDLVRSQQPTDGAHDEGAATLGETVANPAMQWTLVDLGTASCDTPGCDPAKCDAEDCQEDGLATSYQEMPDYATAGVTGPGPAPEPMVGRGEPGVSAPEANPAAEPKKRGRGKKAATDSAVFPEQAAAPAAKPKRGAAKKGAKKPAAKKAAKKGAKKPATKAKKGAAKKGAKKPATPRGKKAAATPGANGQAATDAPMPTEKAA